MITLDGYVDVERIGRGGLGDVYRATHESTGAVVAIKVLRDVSDESVAWHRTRRELTALASLAGHAHVIQLIEVLDLPDGPALVMEYAPGGSVADLMLRRDRPLTVAETVLVGRQTAAALVAAHEQGIVHRDVKPQNLLIDAYGQVKLCDFGIAAMARSDEFQARTSAVSMRYASPEDLDDEVEVGPASDIYSLGATMLHLARGAPPTLRERLAPWEPPTTDDDELAALDRVMATCLHPTPEARPSAGDLVDELERLGWSSDGRNQALAFAPEDHEVVDGRSARDAALAGGVSDTGADDDPTVPRPASGDAVVDPPEAPAPPPGDEADRIDDTVYRTDRRMPTPPSPRRRRRPTVLAALAIVAVGAVILASWWGSSDDPTIESTERPDGLPPITELDWPLGPVGECLVQVGDDVASVTCAEPHDLQRIAAATLDPRRFGPDAVFDPDEVRLAVRTACDAAFDSLVGEWARGLEVPFSAPSAETWERDGDRTYQCLVGLDGRRIVGDVLAG